MKKSLRYFYYNVHKREQSHNCSTLERVALHNCSDQKTLIKD
jgi:hypothetical protein